MPARQWEGAWVLARWVGRAVARDRWVNDGFSTVADEFVKGGFETRWTGAFVADVLS
jgi:hypothetical protein